MKYLLLLSILAAVGCGRKQTPITITITNDSIIVNHPVIQHVHVIGAKLIIGSPYIDPGTKIMYFRSTGVLQSHGQDSVAVLGNAWNN